MFEMSINVVSKDWFVITLTYQDRIYRRSYMREDTKSALRSDDQYLALQIADVAPADIQQMVANIENRLHNIMIFLLG